MSTECVKEHRVDRYSGFRRLVLCEEGSQLVLQRRRPQMRHQQNCAMMLHQRCGEANVELASAVCYLVREIEGELSWTFPKVLTH